MKMHRCEKCNNDIPGGSYCIEEGCPLAPKFESEPIQKDEFEEIFAESDKPSTEMVTQQEEPEVPKLIVRTIKLSGGRIITLNEQQTEAVNLMFKFNEDRDALFFALSGSAGSGKTTIVKEVIQHFANRNGGMHRIAVSAPTHKAKKVIAQATRLDAATLQSLLGLAPNTELADFDINKPEFSQSKKPTIDQYRMIVLDEGSMVNKDLWTMLKEQARRFNVKLLIMGDLNQLPPVKETISQAFIDPDVLYKYKLTKVERQADGNPLMFLYDAILSDLNVDKDKFPHEDIVRTEPRPDQGGPEDPRDPFVEVGHRFHSQVMPFGRAVMKEFMSEDFRFDNNHCKVLCWTNARVAWWNQSIRKTLMMDLNSKPTTTEEVKLHAGVLMPFEILMAQTNSGDLTNSSDYQVISMQFTEKTIWYGEKKDKSKQVSGYRVALMDIDENTILNTFILDPDEDNVKNFTIIFNDYLFLAKTKRAWTAYYAFKAEVMLIKDIKDVRGQMVCKKDLEYAYAISIHKSQGSTYNQVFIDMADINNNRNWIERNKLKYVAFSRPRYLATVLTGS